MRKAGSQNEPLSPEVVEFLAEQRMQIALEIRKALKSKKMTMQNVADLAGIHKPQVVRVLNGKGSYLDTTLKILDAAGLEITIRPKTNKPSQRTE